VAKLDLALDLPCVSQNTVMPALEGAECHVGKALQVQLKNAEIERLFDQKDCLFSELLLVTQERKNHPDRQTIVEREPSGEIDRDDGLQSEYGILYGRERNPCATERDMRAHDVSISIEP
jgi:hypothetical protein